MILSIVKKNIRVKKIMRMKIKIICCGVDDFDDFFNDVDYFDDFVDDVIMWTMFC